MFRSATVKIAHSSTIPVPALIGNEELRPLQDLIAAEKVVLASLQKLSADFAKAADAMRAWALSEGDAISDILSSSRTLLSHFSGALNHYSSIQNVVRDNLKAVRTREEFLVDLRRRRRRAAASVETIRRKLTRMNRENKAFGAQMYALNLAGEDMRDLDAKIAHEESTIGDFKRKCTRNWLTLKFGGLGECCEKGMIVAEIGKRMVFVGNALLLTIVQSSNSRHHQELSDSPKTPYGGHNRMTSLLFEAQHRIVQVVFSGAPSAGCETPETPCPSVSQNRPNCFKDLPEIREEPASSTTSVEYIPSISSRSSTDPVSPPEHVLSRIGPPITSTPAPDYQVESSPSSCELLSAPPPGRTRGTTGSSGDRSYFSFMRSRSIPLRLDSIAEGDEPLPSPSISSDMGDARSCLNRSPDLHA
ncbi:hypothetical protein AZE42_02882 [Rhizopogon vesiculosus]|uniref:Uncharacterized protein n=1 Tax=Rhizopogon vesiculosus TaxID=180088 RepID=A0A1J8PYA8_9AGAM|nr:hypothetical protein AZE42_02882 [Rhizopogon vesiculosus]